MGSVALNKQQRTGVMQDPKAILASVFGFTDFRPGQAEIVDAVTAGEPVLAIMPTGGGKSLCFQLPALLRDGLTVVISPLTVSYTHLRAHET